MTPESPLFKQYTAHVLKWEGERSSDPEDSAASCAPYSGGVHTVLGVTFCTFKKLAAGLGIYPVSYDRFLTMSDADAGKFLYRFYLGVQGDRMPDLVALAVTEAAWLSGQTRAAKTLQEAINALGGNLTVDGIIGPKTIAATNQANPGSLYDQFWKERIDFIDQLSKNPQYDQYRQGWFNRIASFLQSFEFATTGAGIIIIAALITAFAFRKEIGLS